MPSGAIGGVVAPIIGGIFQGRAARDAARAQVDAANANNATQLELFNRQTELERPWRDAGVFGLNQLRTGLADNDSEFRRTFQGQEPGPAPAAPKPEDIRKDPGYQFRMEEGLKALEGSAASRGGLLSGGTLKGIQRWGQGLASDEFERADQRYRRDLQENDRQWNLYQDAFNRFNANSNTRFNRLTSLSGGGQTSNQALRRAGETYGTNTANNNNNIGNARAQEATARGNAWFNAIEGAANGFSRFGRSGS